MAEEIININIHRTENSSSLELGTPSKVYFDANKLVCK